MLENVQEEAGSEDELFDQDSKLSDFIQQKMN